MKKRNKVYFLLQKIKLVVHNSYKPKFYEVVSLRDLTDKEITSESDFWFTQINPIISGRQCYSRCL